MTTLSFIASQARILFMSLSGKERKATIWIGIAIGVACSSMLVRYALLQKEKKMQERPGNFDSGITASAQIPFPPLPPEVLRDIPHGLVIFHDGNGSVEGSNRHTDSWVIETSGSFRSERLFILVEKERHSSDPALYFRASELYVLLQPEKSQDHLVRYLNEDTHKIIGRNHKTKEYIVQGKGLEPAQIRKNLETFRKNEALFAKVRIPNWLP